jgi:hypothetical protein
LEQYLLAHQPEIYCHGFELHLVYIWFFRAKFCLLWKENISYLGISMRIGVYSSKMWTGGRGAGMVLIHRC